MNEAQVDVAIVLRDIERIPEAAHLRGHASFVDNHTLEVGGHTRVAAKAVVVATGWALQNQMTIEAMLEMPYYHPVLEEGLRTALRNVNAKLHGARRAGADTDTD